MYDISTTNGLPNLFILGVPKSGTTSLFRYLQKSQEVFGPTVKEPSFFSNTRDFETGLDTYLKLFRKANHKVSMEATSCHFYGADVLAPLFRSMKSKCKVVIILRDPVDRFRSFHGFLQHMGIISNDLMIDQFLAQTSDGKAISDLANEDYHIDGELYQYSPLLGGFYAGNLSAWADVFGDDLRLYFFDDLKDRPAELMTDISQFLGIHDVWQNHSFEVENKTIQPRAQILHGLLVKLYGKVGTVINAFPKVKRFLLNTYMRLNAKSGTPKVDKTTCDKLRAVYKADLEQTAKVINAKVSYFGTLPDWLQSSTNKTPGQ